MFTRTQYAFAYAYVLTQDAKQQIAETAKETITTVKDHKSEIAVAAGTAAVVGLAARVNGFKAGYAFANQS